MIFAQKFCFSAFEQNLFSVHYKNWNKRYDEWVVLESVMRIYDESGEILKSRVAEKSSAASDDSDQSWKNDVSFWKLKKSKSQESS